MMPVLALVGIPRWRWLPPIPIPLFVLWPLVPLGFGLAKLLDHARPVEADKLRIGLQLFCELRGLSISVDTADHKQLIWFL